MLSSLRPTDLAARQLELDRAAMQRFPSLAARKRERMAASPHALLRGSAPLFYEILAARPDLAAGPGGEGFLVGDMHLENVGAYRTDENRVVFNLNDFDDAGLGPWRFDVLRLATSTVLAARAVRATGDEAIALAERVLRAYRGAAWGQTVAPPLPQPIAALVEDADGRSPRALLDARAPLEKGRRHLVRGERYLDLPADLAAAVPDLVRAYFAALGDRAPKHAGQLEVEDQALRVAGTGSLGGVRIALLLRDHDGDERVFELKQANPASMETLTGSSLGKWPHPSDRVVGAARALVREPTRLLASVVSPALGLSFIGRKLTPQEDKLAIDTFKVGAKLDCVVETIGHLVGTAHARAVVSRPEAPWSDADLAAVVDRALELAGLFEGLYLAYLRASR